MIKATVPSDKVLYEQVRNEVFDKIPTHSAYRSGHLVKTYKKRFSENHGVHKSPYKTKKNSKKINGLKRWFAEKWVNQRGEIGYKYKNDIYRPTFRITKETPKTHKELSQSQLRKSRLQKYRNGRVKSFG